MKRCIRIVAGLLALSLLLLITPPSAASASGEQGDLNGDFRVTAADAAVLLRALRNPADLPGEWQEHADLTQSGVVNTVDVRVLLFMAAGKIPDLVSFVARVSTGLCEETLFDRFCYTGARQDGASYYDDAVSITVTEGEYRDAVYYFADIYVQELSRFRTAFSSGKYRGRGQRTDDIAASVDALIAVNGDYYTAQDKGPIVRNGEWFRTDITDRMDIAVLTYAGKLLTFEAGRLRRDTLLALHPYQTWVFGPRLLDENGQAFDTITGVISGANPRTAIGYFSPGHYCLMVADGRQKPYSAGLSLTDLSALMASFGCQAAYNLDGGQTAMMATADELINSPFRNGRTVSDIIYIGVGA